MERSRFLAVGFVALAMFLGVLSGCSRGKSEAMKAMAQARADLAAADMAGASAHAPATYKSARAMLDRADSQLKKGNYGYAKAQALKAGAAAKRAGDEAAAKKAALEAKKKAAPKSKSGQKK
ncbi:MAG: hypothetical protein ACT4O3_07480 [Elusimicrobiota bacterium]